MGRFDGRVALITGGARGQGRSHAVALASEGADIVLFDVPQEIATLPYPTASGDDLAETVSAVEATGQRCVDVAGDVRDLEAVNSLVGHAIEEFGKIDILVCNHGICSYFEVKDMPEQAWQDMVDVNLTGTFQVCRAVVPHMKEAGYGRVIITSSGLARQGQQQVAHYIATKWGLLGFTKSLAIELAQEGITVNAILPTTVDTPMIMHDAMYQLFRPDLDSPTADDMAPILSMLNVQGVPWVEPADITYGVLYLADERARYVTGGGLDVGAGWNTRSSS